MIALVIGGAKSGKSMFAQNLAKSLENKSGKLYYIATMKPYDLEDLKRIENHLNERVGYGFNTIEEHTNMSKVVKEGTKNSKYANLDYKVLKYDKDLDLSVLKILLHTGRHHQIRVQLASRGHSIYGDQKYGGRGHGKQITLWAYSLTILHPITKEKMEFKAIPQKIGSWKILEGIDI